MNNSKDSIMQFPYNLIMEKHRVILNFFQQDGFLMDVIPLEYSSIFALFYTLLYSEDWSHLVSSKWRSTILKVIEKVYFFEDRPAFYLTPSERYMLYHQYFFKNPTLSRMLEFTVHHRKGRVAEDMIVPILKKFEAKSSPDKNYPSFDSYENMLRAAEDAQTRVPIKDIFSFPTVDALASWIFQKIIDSNKDFQICPLCGRYFIPDRKGTIHCSPECRQSQIASQKFCGIPEIQGAYGCIMTAFCRKKKSKKLYIYTASSDAYHGSYDEHQLLKDVLPATEDLLSRQYSQHDFSAMHDSFRNENKMRYKSFKEIHKAYKKGSINEADYIPAKETYITWLENVREQLKLFEYY